jgi:LuxR family maltose regulon positive regulatory protein
VSGPAGSGKTSCVAQWARALTTPVVWVSLRPGDDSLAALRERLTASWPGITPAEDAAFVDALGDLDEETVLVCDGLEVVSDPLAIAELDALCADAPDRLHLVLVGRVIPPLPALARIRLSGELEELNARDLACREDEAAAIFESVGVETAVDALRTLIDRSEGLIAAVAFAAVLSRTYGAAEVLPHFGGAVTELGQYFYTEVLNDLPVDVVGFMLATSVLDQLTPAACDSITDRTDSKEVLEELTRRNALTTAIDGESYRYHRLLREFLASELARTQPDRFRALHRRAALFNERRGEEDAALRHWVEAGELDEAWNRFNRRALPRFFDGAVTSVAQWTALLPKPSEQVDVLQAYDMALTLIFTGDVVGADEWRQLADAQVSSRDANGDAVGRKTYLQFLLELARGDLLRGAQTAANARRLLQHSTWNWDELRAPLAVAQLELLLGRTERARVTIDEFEERVGGQLVDAIALATERCELGWMEGALSAAEAHAVEAIEAARTLPDPEFWFSVQARYVMAFVLIERNELDAARREADMACAISAKQGFVHARLSPLIARARVQHLAGEYDDARETLERARRLFRRHDPSPLLHRVTETEARFALADGDISRTERLLPDLHEPARSILQARMDLAEGRDADAAAAIEAARPTNRRDRIEVLLVRAALADEARAAELVAEALELAEPDGYMRVFVDHAPSIAPHVRRLVGTWPTRFAAEVAAAVVAEPDHSTSARNLADLSEREQEVWRFLTTSLSMHEIADALYVSRNTLKSHVRSIYRKLGVGTREEAVGRGRGARRPEASQ